MARLSSHRLSSLRMALTIHANEWISSRYRSPEQLGGEATTTTAERPKETATKRLVVVARTLKWSNVSYAVRTTEIVVALAPTTESNTKRGRTRKRQVAERRVAHDPCTRTPNYNSVPDLINELERAKRQVAETSRSRLDIKANEASSESARVPPSLAATSSNYASARQRHRGTDVGTPQPIRTSIGGHASTDDRRGTHQRPRLPLQACTTFRTMSNL